MPKASPVALPNPTERSGSIELGPEPEQARDFHFAVTWVTLFAHLDPIEASGPRLRPENAPPSLALVPVVAAAALVEQRVDQDSAAWEMVVPKMIRTENGEFSPDDSSKPKLL
jgi:hypothetical protein